MTLSDIRVIDLSNGIAGGYLAKLFVDAGADVIVVEARSGSALRHRSASLFAFLAAGTRSVTGDIESADVTPLLEDADVIIVDETQSPAEVQALRSSHPAAVVTSIRPYGLTGPWALNTFNEFLIQADAGSIISRGLGSMPPYAAGGEMFLWMAACYAAPPTLVAALDKKRGADAGNLIDVSIAEGTAIAGSVFTDLMQQLSGRTEPPSRSTETPSIEPTLDGWVGFNTNTGLQFQAFCLLIERPDLMESDWSNPRVRLTNFEEWTGIVHSWTKRHTTDEVVRLASELRVPVARVNNAASLLAEDHLAERDFFATYPDGFRAPRPPRIIDGERPAEPRRAPDVGEHDGTVTPRPGSTQPSQATQADRPLEGLKVLDVTSWWAGPSSTQMLAALGADVIHVESMAHPDGMRLTGRMFGKNENWWEWGHMFVAANHDKRAVTLDLSSPTGRDLLLQLVDTADLFVENFSPRVIEGFDLDWDTLSARNPNLVMVRMPAFGLAGPWRERVGFAQTMEQMSGMAWLTGHPNDQPRIPRGPCDPIAGMHGAFNALLGLRKAELTGKGVFVESTMIESAVNCAAEMVIEWTANGVALERLGNRSRHAAPQGVYQGSDAETWLAVSVETDEQWRALAKLIGRDPSWTFAQRQAGHDDIDAAMETLVGSRTVGAAEAALQEAGVPAVVCRNHAALHQHPQFEARGFFELVDHPAVGEHHMPGQPFRMDGIDRWIRTPTPTLGQHNHDVLAALGFSTNDIADLEERNEIGTTLS